MQRKRRRYACRCYLRMEVARQTFHESGRTPSVGLHTYICVSLILDACVLSRTAAKTMRGLMEQGTGTVDEKTWVCICETRGNLESVYM